MWMVVHPLVPVSRTNSPSPLIPLPSRERGKWGPSFPVEAGIHRVEAAVILDLIQNPQGGACR